MQSMDLLLATDPSIAPAGGLQPPIPLPASASCPASSGGGGQGGEGVCAVVLCTQPGREELGAHGEG